MATELLSDLRGNRERIARAAQDELAIVHSARAVFSSALDRRAEQPSTAANALLDVVATREVLERQRRAIEVLHAHAILLEALLLEYA